ncbi:SRC kinase signaling inhibitor 1 [Chanos chanos]|uniref:SRC kinase signaling inhibitor 1 n=1 Tax=Chanos chanos TaxID=29144 RepID=A0A6J2V1F3_CHACN|nr:SRC kinase signaling inhibitor 1-like [Chanos chanos]
MIRGEDAEYSREYHTLGNTARRLSLTSLHKADMEALTKLHKSEAERQREGQYKNKYPPQHAATLVNTNCSRQQQPNYWSFKARTPRSVGSCCLSEQASRVSFASAESLERMSDSDFSLGFSRTNRLRQSLPLARSPSQSKLRAPGVLFLQFGDETRRVHITHELTSMETLHALIVHMFPQKLTMGALRSPSTAILIKDETRNVFYQLEDPRDVKDRCVIKIYCREPFREPAHYAPHAPHGHHIANGDLRRELVYSSSRESSPTRRLNTLPSSSSPSGSPSRSHSRLSYTGGRPSSYAGPPPSQPHPYHHTNPAHQPHPHSMSQHHPGFGPAASAILERRDVKPDEEMTSSSSKSVVLLKNEAVYADPYTLVHDGRLSVASPQAMAYRRGSVRSLGSYSAAALQCELEGALYRPGGPLYTDPYATMGFRSLPPPSPQRVADPRDPYAPQPGRGSPGRQVLRKDGMVFVESPKSRGMVAGPGAETVCMMGGADGGGLSGYASPLPGNETETRERMEAMEKQIASLTGLVQSVLSRGPDSPDKAETASDCSATEHGRLKKKKAVTPSAPLALMPPPPTATSQPITVSRSQMQLHLSDLQQNTVELRKQLSQLRKLQLQNQDSVQAMLRKTESDLGVCLMDALRTQEDPLQRQRLLVEEERLRYLNEEELIIQQLHDLEHSVEEMRTGAGLNHCLVTEQEVEEKSQELRRLGETLSDLKNQFPTLQSKMRVVLRVEVEAVKFLKEEPLRLDALIKRCRTITDTLSLLRRQISEGVWRGPEDSVCKRGDGDVGKRGETDILKAADLDMLSSPPLSLTDLGATLTGATSVTGTLGTGANLGASSNLGGATSIGSSLGATTLGATLGGTNLASGMGSSSGIGGALGGSGLGGGASLANWMSCVASDASVPEQDASLLGTLRSRGLEDLPARREPEKSMSVEVRLAAERDWEEKRASLTQFSAQDINRLLEETQAELLKAIPDLDLAAKQMTKPAVPPKPQLSSLPGHTTPTSSGSTPSSTPEHQPPKPPPKPGKDTPSRRGSGELTVPRYRTEKPSKSPPPPPPRRSFPSTHGITTTRTGEVVITSKSMKKSEKAENSEETESQMQTQTPPVKLRRPSASDGPRPSSTPPVIAASGIKDDENEEEKIMAELEVFERTPVRVRLNPLYSTLPNTGRNPSCLGQWSTGSLGRESVSTPPSSGSGSGSGKVLSSSRLKHVQQSSLERRSRKQREDFPKLQQGQQQVFHF